MGASKVFIGSSSEGLEVARQVQVALVDETIEVILWEQGVFGPGKSYLSALLEATESFDFAVLVLTSDDTVVSRGDEYDAPRDNALIELGLFLGSIGRERSFFMYDKSTPPKIASDLEGICGVTFYGKDRNIKAAVGSACTIIRDRIRDLGPISKESQSTLIKNGFSEAEKSKADYSSKIYSWEITYTKKLADSWLEKKNDPVLRECVRLYNNRDRGKPCDFPPPTPPGIRVRTRAVRLS